MLFADGELETCKHACSQLQSLFQATNISVQGKSSSGGGADATRQHAAAEELSGQMQDASNTAHAFQVIYISQDSTESSFETSIAAMPWLALPYRSAQEQRIRQVVT